MKKKNGFTIIELLTVLCVAVIVAVIMFKPIISEFKYQLITASIRADLPLLRNSYSSWINNQLSKCDGGLNQNGWLLESNVLYDGRTITGILNRTFSYGGVSHLSAFDATSENAFHYITAVVSMYSFDNEYKKKHYQNSNVYDDQSYDIHDDNSLNNSPLGNKSFNENRYENADSEKYYTDGNNIKSITLALLLNKSEIINNNAIRLSNSLNLPLIKLNNRNYLLYNFPIIQSININGNTAFKRCFQSDLKDPIINYDNTSRLEYYKSHENEK